jgi:hypothetical protein
MMIRTRIQRRRLRRDGGRLARYCCKCPASPAASRPQLPLKLESQRAFPDGVIELVYSIPQGA